MNLVMTIVKQNLVLNLGEKIMKGPRTKSLPTTSEGSTWEPHEGMEVNNIDTYYGTSHVLPVITEARKFSLSALWGETVRGRPQPSVRS
jgi:hypothetical protein